MLAADTDPLLSSSLDSHIWFFTSDTYFSGPLHALVSWCDLRGKSGRHFPRIPRTGFRSFRILVFNMSMTHFIFFIINNVDYCYYYNCIIVIQSFRPVTFVSYISIFYCKNAPTECTSCKSRFHQLNVISRNQLFVNYFRMDLPRKKYIDPYVKWPRTLRTFSLDIYDTA